MQMNPILDTTHARPIEREYEGWTVEGIERYFRRIGRHASVWAVSPKLEPAWPADEIVSTSGKLVGLQFKQNTAIGMHGSKVFEDRNIRPCIR